MATQKPITSEEIMAKAHALQAQIVKWRRTIHQQPELGFTEVKTARLVSSVLHDLGIEAETGVAKTGVVGRIDGEGPVVGLRADMDALPIQEQNGTPFDSTQPGIMHACGHDAHTAMLLGAATILKGFADEGRLEGGVRLLFQPSEESRDENNQSGGKLMVAQGALKGLDAVFGLHVDASTPVGKVSTRAGSLLAAGDSVQAVIRGTGGHGAMPHLANDPLVLAAHFLLAVQNIVSRRLDPLEAGVISLTTIHGGTAINVIPETVTLAGTMRSLSPATRELLQAEMHRACKVVEALGGSVDLTITPGYPPTVNDPTATALAVDSLSALLGTEQVFEPKPIMASEDFSFMLQQAPGCFIMLGVQNPAWGQVYPVHTPTFQLDEAALPIGTAALVTMAVEWMKRKP